MRHGINEKRLLKTFLELITINSPSFEEKELGKVLASKLKKAGCRVKMQAYDRSFNLIAFKRGSDRHAPPLLLSGHMDTIEPTEGMTFSTGNGMIKTTGHTVLGADDKSALAQIIEAVTVLKERNIRHGDLEIVFTSAEEKGLCGAKNLPFSSLRSRHALVLDSGGSVGNLVTAAPTHITYEMRVTGRPAHAGIEPEKGISAIRVASMIISQLPDGRINPETTANIGMIRGGTATNVVPKKVVIHGEVRGHKTADIEKLKKKVFETAEAIARRNQAGLQISEEEEYRAFRISKKDPFLQFLAGVFTGCGLEPVYTVTGGGSDANILNQNGIRAINISTGMQQVHSHEEYIRVKDLFNGSLVVLNAIANFPKAGLRP